MGSYPHVIDVNNTICEFMKLNFSMKYSVFYHIWGAFFVMIAVLASQKLKKIFSWEPLVYIGKISFSVYIIHFIVLCSFSCYLFLKLIVYLRYYQAVFFTSILSMMIIMILSHFMHKYIDTKGIKLSKNIYLKYFSQN